MHEIEGNARKTRERLSVMLSAYKRYKDSLGSVVTAQSAFSASLHDFYVGGGKGDMLAAAGMPLGECKGGRGRRVGKWQGERVSKGQRAGYEGDMLAGSGDALGECVRTGQFARV